jgi:hypothetical protein
MIIAIWIATLVLATATVLMFGALIELFEQLKQLRGIFGFEDGTSPVDLPDATGRRPSDAGLPSALDDLHRSALIVFVSDMCATCRRLADGLRGGPSHPDLWVVVVHVTSRAADFVEEFALHGERVIHDTDKSIVDALGITMTPLALVVTDGRIERAQTIPSLHQLDVAMRGVAEVAAARAELNI